MVCKHRTLLISSPAKLNLFLDVLNKRPDGYHNIVTVFERINLCDTLRLTEIAGDKIRVSSTSSQVPAGPANLAYKAAALLKSAFNVRGGIRIEIEKNIPVGAGLGGGSSNAAAVLLGLNKLFKLGLSRRDLIGLAGKLGSDTAFFVFNRKFAVGEARGEDVGPVFLPKGLKLWHVIFAPGFQVLTKDVYGLLDKESRAERSLRLTKNSLDANIFCSHLRKREILWLNRNFYNRLSQTVMKSYSLVSELRTHLLDSGIEDVHMSGSGPALFTIFEGRQKAQKVFRDAQRSFSDKCRIYLAATI